MQKNYIRKKSKCLNFNIFVMNKIDKKDVYKGVVYFPPDITITEVKVEKGFAKTGGETEGGETGGEVNP